jgi:hypothetical protein
MADQIGFWACQDFEWIGYSHNQYLTKDENIFLIAKKISDLGLNVMIQHITNLNENGDPTGRILWVDDISHRFGQR